MTPHQRRSGSAARVAWLVQTTPLRRALAAGDGLGAPAYSYHFAFECLRPALERLGTVEALDDPAGFAAAADRARTRGESPIHLALVPPSDSAHVPGLPRALFPFWEFPDVPDRPLGGDPSQDWAAVARRADAILTACPFTAAAFERATPGADVVVVPVPCPEPLFAAGPWEPGGVVAIECRHAVFGPSAPAAVGTSADGPAIVLDPPPERGALHRMTSGLLTRLEPTLGPVATARLFRAGRVVKACRPRPRAVLRALRRGGPAKLAFVAARSAYRGSVKRVLNADAMRAITERQHALMRRLGRDPLAVRRSSRPVERLELSGTVFTSVLNLGDRRKNPRDLLSAFLHGCRDRADATLVLKLACRPGTIDEELTIVGQILREVAPRSYRCRVVAIADHLDADGMAALQAATTWYACASHAEGACLPLMHAMAAGRPAIAPAHTALADYVDARNALVVGSSPEPCAWPQDPAGRLSTTWHRIVWPDLRDAFTTAAAMVADRPSQYRALAGAARDRLARGHCGDAAVAALRPVAERLTTPVPGGSRSHAHA